jgi:hypothetical protein
VQFPHHLLAGLQQIAAAYSTRVQFEQPEWSQPDSTLATMKMEADTMIYPMTMDPKFRTDTEMAPAPPTEHALWRVAFRYDPGLGAAIICRCSNFTNNRSKEIILSYGHVIQAFRGLGRLMTAAEAATRPNFNTEAELNFEERIQFDTLCFMLECSRNAVMRPSYLKVLLRVSALLGINAIMLYTEDTYQVVDTIE